MARTGTRAIPSRMKTMLRMILIDRLSDTIYPCQEIRLTDSLPMAGNWS
jgi:hypothetical protein